MNIDFNTSGARPGITIGVPVHNEEKTLPEFFRHFVRAIEDMPRSVAVEGIFCINGCTDHSREVLDTLIKERPDLDLRVIESDKGKINAELAVIKERRNQGFIGFMDADVLPAADSISLLYEKMETDTGCQVAYAAVQPYYPPDDSPNMFQNILATHYRYRDRQEERKFFHGRMFLMRDASAFDGIYDDVLLRLQKVEDQRYIPYLGLQKGALIDDIYLSRVIAHKHDLGAIAQVPEAVVQFQPPKTLDDYVKVMERTMTEIKRLDMLYPEHAYLQREHFQGNPQRQFELSASAMTPQDRDAYRFLVDLARIMREKISEKLTLPQEAKPLNSFTAEGWATAESTKQEYFVQIIEHADREAANEEEFLPGIEPNTSLG